MDSTDPTRVSMNREDELRAEILRSLGLYRSEYIEHNLASLFAQPVFWSDLVSRRPAFLEGGRGTGKTFALRMLAYEGQSELASDMPIAQWPVLGIYWRLSVLALAAFTGKRIDEEQWIRLFGHWVNLQLVDRLLQFVVWRRTTRQEVTVTRAADLGRVARSLGLEPTDDPEVLRERLLDHLSEFQAAVNGTGSVVPAMKLSVPGEPFKALLAALGDDPAFAGRWVTICLDEFENLEDYQQRVFNTLLKHIGDAPYTMKIGVKLYGLRDTHTLNARERVGEIADYISIDIAKVNKARGFANFASEVCAERLAMIREDLRGDLGPADLFPELSESEEADLLGVQRANAEVRSEIAAAGATIEELRHFDGLNSVHAYLIGYCARAEKSSTLQVLRDAIAKPKAWSNKVNNYSYASLFTIRPASSGQLDRKYYAGWSTFLLLADGNIRYLLDLVSTALIRHIDQGQDLTVPLSPGTQTYAARAVGRKIVLDLDGQDAFGKQILNLVQGIGRIFGVMARQPWGHTPEVNQFTIAWTGDETEYVERLLTACTMNSALVPFEGNKRAAASSETRTYDYELHPIFAPYFEYSHRHKRKMTLSSEDIAALSNRKSAGGAVERVLLAQKRGPDVVPSNALFDWVAYD